VIVELGIRAFNIVSRVIERHTNAISNLINAEKRAQMDCMYEELAAPLLPRIQPTLINLIMLRAGPE